MQPCCLCLTGRKLLVSLAMEDKFNREGLQSLDEDDDMLAAMAREHVTGTGVWRVCRRGPATDSGREQRFHSCDHHARARVDCR